MAALAFGAETMKTLCTPGDGVELCGMIPERWAELISQIEQVGEIEPGSVTAADCFDASFLPGADQASVP